LSHLPAGSQPVKGRSCGLIPGPGRYGEGAMVITDCDPIPWVLRREPATSSLPSLGGWAYM
jgi:hypothetical protein